MELTIKQSLQKIVGPENFSDALIDMISYSSDASEHHHRPDAAVWVESVEQVSAILKLANEHKVPVIPRGAGTSLSGMAVPERGGIVLDMSPMNKILNVSIEDRLAVVQPGVVYDQLEKALAPYGFFFPPDPASGKVSTLGGNVATNAGGLKGAKYGTTSDYVLALKVVLADGSILRTGSKCMKSVSGYDLTKLFVGSEGTLGVVTEITLKVNPKPLATATCQATFDDLAQAGNAVSEIMRSGIIPRVLEFLDDQCISALNQSADLNLPEVAAMLLAETDGYTKEETEYQMSKVVKALKNNNAIAIARAASAEEAEELWKARKSIYAALTRLNYNITIEDVTVPISKVAQMLVGIKTISKHYNLPIPTVGHLGDGNLHPGISFDGTNPDEVEKVEKVATDIFRLAIELGGTLTGEHGIGLGKADYMSLEHDVQALRVMNNLKRMFDPNNILNPGKMGLAV